MGERRKHVSLCMWAVFAVAACGGDDDSSSGVVTGLPAEQKLSELSDADVKKACRSVNEGASVVISPTTLKRATCMPFGLQAAVTYTNNQPSIDVNKCQQAVDACVRETEQDEEAGDGVNDCEQSSASDLKGCEATVGEYEACINMVLNKTQQLLAELTCQNAEKLSSEAYSQDELDPTTIPQCQTVMAKCPDTQLGIPFAE